MTKCSCKCYTKSDGPLDKPQNKKSYGTLDGPERVGFYDSLKGQYYSKLAGAAGIGERVFQELYLSREYEPLGSYFIAEVISAGIGGIASAYADYSILENLQIESYSLLDLVAGFSVIFVGTMGGALTAKMLDKKITPARNFFKKKKEKFNKMKRTNSSK